MAAKMFQYVMMNESSKIVLLGDYDCNLLEENSLAHICDTYDLHNLVTSATFLKVSKVHSLTYVLYQSPYIYTL